MKKFPGRGLTSRSDVNTAISIGVGEPHLLNLNPAAREWRGKEQDFVCLLLFYFFNSVSSLLLSAQASS